MSLFLPQFCCVVALLLYCTPVYCYSYFASVISRELMFFLFFVFFLHIKTLVYFLNLDFECLGPLNRELNVSSRHDMHSWHWPPKRRDSRNSVCVLKEGVTVVTSGRPNSLHRKTTASGEWKLWGKGKERWLVVGGAMVSWLITGEISTMMESE